MRKACILFCNCGAGVISSEKSQQIKSLVEVIDADLFYLDDFCGVVLNRKDFIRDIEQNYERKLVLACYPRAIKNLLMQNGLMLSELEILNFREQSIDEIGYRLRTEYSIVERETIGTTIESGLNVPAWYPVIDQSSCSNCGKCFKFCLFGVYSFPDKNLNVVKPLSCKNNCPACGRNCPTSAIIFPRLKEGGVLAGAEPGSEQQAKEIVMNSKLISTLNQRSAMRRTILKTGVMEQAEEERRKALEELKNLNKD